MARSGYLGKISAIVSINTSSVKPSLDSSAKDINAWAKSTQSRISGAANSAGRALEGIFTPLQRLQAAIKNANRNPLDLKIQNPGAYLQLAKATEQIAKPLGQVQSQFAGLASSVQAELLPVLQSAQKQTTSLFNAISSGAKVSDRDLENTAARVERLNQVIRRSAEANQLARGGRTGNELAFAAPRTQDELSRSAQLSQRAAEAPVALRADPGFRQRIQELDELRQKIVQYQSAVDRRQVLGLDTTEVQARLDGIIRKSADTRASLEQVTADAAAATRAFTLAQSARQPRSGGLFGVESGTDQERAIERARRLSAEFLRLPQAAQQGLSGLAGIASRVADAVAAGTGNAQQLNDVLDKLASRISDGSVASGQQELGRQIGNGFLNILTPAEAAADTLAAKTQELARKIGNGFLNVLTPAEAAADTLDAKAQQLARKIGNGFLTIITPAEAAADTLEAKTQELARKIGNGFLNVLTPAEAAADTLEAKTQELARKIGNGFLNVLTPAEAAADTLEAKTQELARKISNGFLTILTPAEAAADTLEAKTQELARTIGNGFLSILTPAEAAADTIEAQAQSLGRKIGNGFLTILTPAEAAADTLEAQTQELARTIGNGFLNVLTPAEAAADTLESRSQELGRKIGNGFLTILTPAEAAADTLEAQTQELGRTIANGFLTVITPAEAAADTLEAKTQELGRQIGNGFLNIITPAEAAADTLESQTQALGRKIANGFLNIIDPAEAAADTIGGRLDQRLVRGYEAQLNVLQGVIATVSGEARGNLASAFEQVRTTINSSMRDATIGSQAARDSIDSMIDALARMSATASNQNVGRVLTQVARAGDIGRRGLDRFALAAQQAGFAIDDFFSVTGGFDQRIRAVSNNITQLAFIIGSTKGLFIGLSVVIGTQVVLAISKWINSGRTAEDRSKALNDTLARQKNLAEALAESFRSLGDALTRGTLSNQAEDAREFAESLNRARKARKDLNDEAVLQNDPVVRRERANQARIDRELQNAGDQGTVVQLQTQLEQSRQRERARRGVLVQPAPGANEVEGVLRRRAPNPFRQNVPNLPDGGDLRSLRERRAALEGPLERLRQIISEGPSFFDGGARFNIASESFDQLNSLAARLDSAISNAVDTIADDLAVAARGPAATIRNAQQEVADAIEAGIPGARRLGVLVDQVGNEFQDAIKALEAAVQIADPAERERAIAEARTRLDGVRGRRSEIEARTDAVRRERTLNPEFQFESVLARAQSEIDRIGAPAQGFQRQLRELQFQRDSVRAQLEAAPADPVLARAEQELTRALISLEQAVSDLSFEAAESSRLRGDPERGRTLSMTDAQRAAEEMQQGLNDIAARFGLVAENTTGLVDNQGMQEAQARFMEDQRRQRAPAVFALQDAVQNAVLQGPSRAALQASDVTTMEGSRELNRLLRGDDPARDVNLLELQKQTQLLEDSLEEQRKLAERFGGVAP